MKSNRSNGKATVSPATLTLMDEIFAATDLKLEAAAKNRLRDALGALPADLQDTAVGVLGAQAAAAAPIDGKVLKVVQAAIEAEKQALNAQVNAVLHDPKFRDHKRRVLEVEKIVLNPKAKKVGFTLLNVSREALVEDMQSADGDYTRTQFYTWACRRVFHEPGEVPYSVAFIGGRFGADDVPLAKSILSTLAESHTLGVSQADPAIFTDFGTYRDLPDQPSQHGEKLQRDPALTEFRGLQADPARATQFVLATVGVLGRKPYHPSRNPAKGLGFFEEDATDPDHWMFISPATVAVNRVTESLTSTGMPAAVVGVESGGKQDVPVHVADGEAVVLERRVDELDERAMAKLGFVLALPWKGDPSVTIYELNSLYVPPADLTGDELARAELARKAALTLVRSKVGHRLKYLLRLTRGKVMTPKKVEALVESDLKERYCLGDPNVASQHELARRPLRSVKAAAEELLPGEYKVTVTLFPHVAASGFDVITEMAPSKGKG